jgi:hypothetical protein
MYEATFDLMEETTFGTIIEVDCTRKDCNA